MTANLISHPKSQYTGIETSSLKMQALIRIHIREHVQTLYDTIYMRSRCLFDFSKIVTAVIDD